MHLRLILFEVLEVNTLLRLQATFGKEDIIYITATHVGLKFGYGKNERGYSNIVKLASGIGLKQVELTPQLYKYLIIFLISTSNRESLEFGLTWDADDEEFLFNKNTNMSLLQLLGMIDIKLIQEDMELESLRIQLGTERIYVKPEKGIINMKELSEETKLWFITILKQTLSLST